MLRKGSYMKLRSDFVTNSSSSSFILARHGELTQEQKEAFVKALVNDFLGNKALTPESTEEEIEQFIEDWCRWDEDKQAEVRKALAEGKSIYVGGFDYEIAEDTVNDLAKSLWKSLKEVNNDITIIDGDLDY